MPSVKKNFIYSALLTTANYIFPLITFPYVSRVLGADSIGLCGFIDSIINYFVLFSTMGMNILGIREIAKAKNDKTQLNKVFSSLFLLNTITTLVMLLALVIASLTVPRLYENYDLMIIGGVKLMFHFLLIEWLYKGLENFRYITIRSIIIRILYVVSVLLFVKHKSDYPIYALLSTMMIVCNAIINLNHSRRVVKLSFKNVDLKSYFKPFFMLGIYNLLTSMYTTFNVSYLGFVTNDFEVGYYVTATKLYTIIFSIYTAFSGVMLPRMSTLLSDGNMQAFKIYVERSFSFLLFMAVPLAIFSVFNAPGIIRLISGSGYEGAILPMRIIMPMMIIIGFELVLIEQILMPMQKDKAVLFNSVVGAVVGVALNVLLVPSLGSVGSAIVKNTCEVIVFCLALYEVHKYASMGLPLKKILHYLISYLPLIILEFFIVRLPIKEIPIMFISMAVCGVYFIVVNSFVIKDFNLISIVNTALSRVRK